VMPDVLARFARRRPGVHVEVWAGRNHALEGDVRSGRMDVAIAFFPAGSDGHGTLIGSIPALWFGTARSTRPASGEPLPLVLYDHPCLFRQAALQILERRKIPWRPALTISSLPGIWAALRGGHGISVRAARRVPAGIRDVGAKLGLPKLPPVELRMLAASELSPAAADLHEIVGDVVRRRVLGAASIGLAATARGRRRAADLF
jgi:DNA-binding transcriptional LysR family regulator